MTERLGGYAAAWTCPQKISAGQESKISFLIETFRPEVIMSNK